MRAIRISENGGPEVLSLTDLGDPTPGAGEIVVDVAAAGVNFVDTYQRIGLYPIAVPYTAGLEGAGAVTAVGAEVADVSVGDRVAWCGGQGSYAERCALDASGVVPVPDGVSLDTAAAAMLQG
ncbi:MAG: alcohol dehydrogenase catalytic domain-containing protein, partial [Acidimicrobiia bacterium]|nr:alcohol dehydrogenase catalytic domain-containing protein [Acidimicrobiia bacterium]